MSASFLSTLRAGPPPPRIALLPDALFFTRAIPIAGSATAAEAGAQVELALEAIAPFPLAQLYYGWFWVPGADHAFAYAAYRRRFTSEQTSGWTEAELVIPASVALFSADVEPATTLLLQAPEGLTAIHWEQRGVPSKVMFRPFEPETTDDERARVRDDLLRALGGSRAVIDLDSAPVADPAKNDREIIFRAGDLVSRFPAATVAALDVRDKADLAALRAAHKRDIILWRVAIGSAAALALLLAGEFALVGGKAWDNTRLQLLKAQKPLVDKIMTSQELATRIDDLTTKRMLPFEMITAMVGEHGERLPADIGFTRVLSTGLYTLTVDVQTNNPAQISIYRDKLNGLPEFEHVDANLVTVQGDRSTYRFNITFKPGALKPSASA